MHGSPAIQEDTSTTVEELLACARVRLKRFTAEQALVAMRDGAQLVDIRSAGQRSTDGVIPGGFVVARNVLEWRLDPTCPHGG